MKSTALLSVILVVGCSPAVTEPQAETPTAPQNDMIGEPYQQEPLGLEGTPPQEEHIVSYKTDRSWPDEAAYYEHYIKQNKSSAGPDKLIIAHSRLGAAQWNQGESFHEEAQSNFKKAIEISEVGSEEFEKLTDRASRYKKMVTSVDPNNTENFRKQLREMIDAIAMARFFVAEHSFEEFRNVSFPNFKSHSTLPNAIRDWWIRSKGPNQAKIWQESLKTMTRQERKEQIGSIQFQYWISEEFRPWFDEISESREGAEKLYLRSVGEGVPLWKIASAARIGQMYHHIAHILLNAPVDPSIAQDQEMLDIYRDALESFTEPFNQQAIQAFDYCIEQSKVLKVENHWVERCRSMKASIEHH